VIQEPTTTTRPPHAYGGAASTLVPSLFSIWLLMVGVFHVLL
jgi:hypothetical protein